MSTPLVSGRLHPGTADVMSREVSLTSAQGYLNRVSRTSIVHWLAEIKQRYLERLRRDKH